MPRAWNAAFWPCARFVGAFGGYAFKRGPLGLGYYPDCPHAAIVVVPNTKTAPDVIATARRINCHATAVGCRRGKKAASRDAAFDICSALSNLVPNCGPTSAKLAATLVDLYVSLVRALPSWALKTHTACMPALDFSVHARINGAGAKEEAARLHLVRRLLLEEHGWHKVCQQTAVNIVGAVDSLCAGAPRAALRDILQHLIRVLGQQLRAVAVKMGSVLENARVICGRESEKGVLASEFIGSLLTILLVKSRAGPTEDAWFADVAALLHGPCGILRLLSRVFGPVLWGTLRLRRCIDRAEGQGGMTGRFIHAVLRRRQLHAARLLGDFGNSVGGLICALSENVFHRVEGAHAQESAMQIGVALGTALHSSARFGLRTARGVVHVHETAALVSQLLKLTLRVIISGGFDASRLHNCVHAFPELCRRRTAEASPGTGSNTFGLLLDCAAWILEQCLMREAGVASDTGVAAVFSHVVEVPLHWIGIFLAVLAKITCPLTARPRDATVNLGLARHLHRLRQLILRVVEPVWLHPNIGRLGITFLPLVIGIVDDLFMYDRSRGGYDHWESGAFAPNQLIGPVDIRTVFRLGPSFLALWDRPSQRRGEDMESESVVVSGPDPDSVQVLVDMGFRRERAETALQKVRSSSVELAMEWLLSNPEGAKSCGRGAGGDDKIMDDVELPGFMELNGLSTHRSGTVCGASAGTASYRQRLQNVLSGSMVVVCRCVDNICAISNIENITVHRSLSTIVATFVRRVYPTPSARCALVVYLVRCLADSSLAIVKSSGSKIAIMSRILATLLGGVGTAPCVRSIIDDPYLQWVIISFLERVVSGGIDVRTRALWALPLFELLHVMLTCGDAGALNDGVVALEVAVNPVVCCCSGSLRIRALRVCIIVIRIVADADVARCVLLLCARLMETPWVAIRFLPLGGLQALLALRGDGAFCGHTTILGIIIERALSCTCSIDGGPGPGMDQCGMEARIRSAVQHLVCPANISVSAFVKEVGCLAVHNCACFFRACATCVELMPQTSDPREARRIGLFLRNMALDGGGQDMQIPKPWIVRAVTAWTQLCSTMTLAPSAWHVTCVPTRGVFCTLSLLRLLSGLFIALPRADTRALSAGCFGQNLHLWLLQRVLPYDRNTQACNSFEFGTRSLRDMKRTSAAMTSVVAMRFLRVLSGANNGNRKHIFAALRLSLQRGTAKLRGSVLDTRHNWRLLSWAEFATWMMQPTTLPLSATLCDLSSDKSMAISWGNLAALANCRILPELAAALNVVDLAHTAAKEVHAALLRPIDILTRPWIIRKVARTVAAKLSPTIYPPNSNKPRPPPPRLCTTTSCYGIARQRTIVLSAGRNYGTGVPQPLTETTAKMVRARLVSVVGSTGQPKPEESPRPHASNPATASGIQLREGASTTEGQSLHGVQSGERTSSYDPAVLAALPDDIRAEMLEAERR